MFAFILYGSTAIAQKDSLYYKYDDLILGLNLGWTNERSEFSFHFFDTVRSETRLNEFELTTNTRVFSSAAFKSKYFSFNYNIAPLSQWLNELGSYSERNGVPSKKSFSFSTFPKQFMINAKYTHVEGALKSFVWIDTNAVSHDSLMAGFDRKQLEFSGTYFFNRKFSFSRAHSLLYFPKKSMFTFLTTLNLFRQMNTNQGKAFIPTNTLFAYNGQEWRFYYNWNHAYSLSYLGAQLLAGAEVFLTFKLEPKGRARERYLRRYPDREIKPIWPYFHISVKGGPIFYEGTLKTIDGSYDTKASYMGMAKQLSIKYGINMRHYNMEAQIFAFKNTYDLGDFNEIQNGKYLNILFAFRIPFKNGYAKIDNRIKRLTKKKDKEVN